MVSNWSLWGIALLLSLSLCQGQITPIRSERCNYVDLGLLLDSSGSIVDEEAWVYEQRFVKQIISRMYVGPDEDHVGMVTFSSTVKILFNLTTFYDLTDMYNTIDITRALDANTYTGLGLRTLREVTFNVSNGDRPNVPDVAIVITDGKSNVFPEQTITEARNLKAAGVRVLVIGITSSINVTELQTIASNLSDVIIVDTYANLTNIVDDIVGKACIPDYGPAECQKKLDLALILDESSSIIFSDPDAWVRDILGFLNNFLKDFNVSQSETRVAAVGFSDTAQILFDFYRYNTTEQLLPAIRRLPFAGGQTNTAAGLRVAASLFSNKTRTNVVNVAFLITDGIPSGVDKDKTPAEADNLRSQGVEVFVVGISDEVGRNDENVKIIASMPTASHYFYVDMFTDLQTIVKNLTTGVCNAIGTTTTPLPTSSTTTTTTSTTPTPSTTTSTTTRASTSTTPTSTSTSTPTTTSTMSSSTSTSTSTSSSTPTSTTTTSTTSTTTTPISPTQSTSGGSGTGSTSPGSPFTGSTSPGSPDTGSTSPGSPFTGSTSPVSPLTGSTSPGSPFTGSTSPGSPFTGSTSPGSPFTGSTSPGSPDTGSTSPVSPFTGSTSPGSPFTGSTSPGSPFTGSTSPGSPFTGSTSPGSPFTGSTSPGSPFTGSTSPGSPFTGSTSPGSPFTGSTSPESLDTGSTSPGSPFTGSTSPGSPFSGSTSPGSPFTGSTSPGSPESGSTSPGSPFTGSTSPGSPFTGSTSPGSPFTGSTSPGSPDTGSSSVSTSSSSGTPTPGSSSSTSFPSSVSSSPVPFGSTTSATSRSTVSLGQVDCPGTSNVFFIVDASATYGASTFDLIKMYLVNVIAQLDVESTRINVGLISYSDVIKIPVPLGYLKSRQEIIWAVEDLTYEGRRTDTAAALQYVRVSGFPANPTTVPRIAVLITNGDSVDTAQTITEAQNLKMAGVLLVTVTVGTWRNMYVLTKVASYPYWKNMIVIDSSTLLNGIISNVSNIVCDKIQPCGSQPCQNGGSCDNYITDYNCRCVYPWAGPDCTQRGCNGSADVVFALDASGSIGEDNFRQVTQFVTNVIASLEIASPSNPNGVQVGLLTYSDNVTIQFLLNNYTNRIELLEAINVPYTRGSTNTAYAIEVARTQMFQTPSGDRSSIPNILVILTDGQSNDPNATWKQAILTRSLNISIIAIGVGTDYNLDELTALASDPTSTNVMTSFNFTSLAVDLNTKLRDALCNDDTYCRSSPCQNGGVCRNILGGYVCDCPQTATGINCERRGTGVIDLMFVLDGSGSIKNDRFSKVKQLVIAIVSQLEIRIDRTRVGVIYYSDYAVFAFNLIQYTIRQDLIQAINRINFIGNRTNTADALRILHEQAFTPENGDRPEVPNIAIVITDGASNINPEQTPVQAIICKQQNIRMITGTLGDFVNMVEIQMIASRPLEKNIFVALSYNDTERNKLALQLINSTVDDYNECTSNPCLNGGRCYDEYYEYVCSCNQFYAGVNCGINCGHNFDVVMILDLSGSVQDEYELVIEFARAVVQGLDIDNNSSRFGLVTFATNVSDVIYMDEYIGQKQSLLDALEFYHEGGYTNTQAALYTVRTAVLDPLRGFCNQTVATRVVLVSDGFSNIMHENTLPEASLIKNLGVLMYSVVINQEHDMTEMEGVASDPTKYVYQLLNATYIEEVARALLRDLCQP